MSLKVRLLKKELKHCKKENKLLLRYCQEARDILARPNIAAFSDQQVRELAKILAGYIFPASSAIN